MADSDIDNLPTYRLGALETKVDRLQEDVKALDGRVTNLSERVAAICERLSALYERVTGFEQRVENRFDKQDERSDRREDRQRSDFRVLFRSILAIGGIMLAAETGLIAGLRSAVSSLFP